MEPLKLSVSKLACACVNESYRLSLARDPAASMPHPYAGSQVVNGNGNLHRSKFHQLVSKFLCDLSEAAVTVSIGDALWHRLYDSNARPLLEELAARDLNGSLNLSAALQAFCNQLSNYHNLNRSWSSVLLAEEYSVSEIEMAKKESGLALLVSGRIDGLRLSPSQRLILVDYKLSRGAHLERDLVQLAIYARCLLKSQHGIQVDGVLEYYEPQLHELPVSFAQLNSVFETVVQPVIDELLQHRARAAAPIPTPQPSDTALGARLKEAFGHFKLGVDIIGSQEAPQLTRFRLSPHPGVKITSLANRADDIQVALGLCQSPRIAPEAGFVSVDIPKEHPDVVQWEKILSNVPDEAWPSQVAFPIGIGVDGILLLGDFADSNMAHALVGGASGSGKSEFLKAMVASLMARNDPGHLLLTLIDPKILTFGAMEGCTYLTDTVLTGLDDAMEVLESAATEMDVRYQRLADERFENLSQRFATGRRELPFWVIVVDEYADLILGDTAAKKAFETLVARIAQKGRSAGIHLVLATQRPDATVVSPLIKANLPLKVCLKVTSNTNSRIILGEIGGESLLGKGDLLCDTGKGIQRAQAPYLCQDELAKVSSRAMAL